MRINRVVLENYGLFAGRIEIDLVPRSKRQIQRPIILVGGMNGSGKTTLLNAIRLALYGKSSLPDRIGERQYQNHLKQMVHRSPHALIDVDYARVGVEFDIVSRGSHESYYVQRGWDLRNGNGKGTIETLEVCHRVQGSKDGDYSTWPALSEVAPEHWQAFVNDVVPERLSQLFFFDGEKIQRIADDISGDSAIAEALHSLLGLDTVARLKADLSILDARETKIYLSKGDVNVLDRINAEIDNLNQETKLLQLKKSEIETESKGIEAEIYRLERQLQEQGGGFFADRPVKQSRKAALESEIESIQRRIRNECEKGFPLGLCPSVATILERQIRFEQQHRRAEILRNELSSIENALVARLSEKEVLPKGPLRAKAIEAVRETLENHLGRDITTILKKPLLALSEADSDQMLEALQEARLHSVQVVLSNCRGLEQNEREIQELTKHLEKAPDEEILAPVFREVSDQNRLLGRKAEELTTVEENIAKIAIQLTAAEKERKRIEDRSSEVIRFETRHELTGKVQHALDEYLSRLASLKVEALCRTVTDCFNKLSRKGDLLNHVRINPSTFEVSLYGRNGSSIPREELSAGEKQILAISILWGLARTSGRPLPVIIDTPLGRLDSDHRLNLVTNYFPFAAHQVVLLSTDTEVDRPLFDELQTHISHCYHLVYDKEERRTVAREEYFWKRVNNE